MKQLGVEADLAQQEIKMKKKVYYAHSIHLYNTPQEERDVKILEQLGFEVINSNREDYQKLYDEWIIENDVKMEDKMIWFKTIIQNVDIVAFRSHVDLKISSGVMYEIDFAIKEGKIIFELPTLTESRRMSLIETKEYLRYNGQR